MLSQTWQFAKNSSSFDLVRGQRTLPATPPPSMVRVAVQAASLNYRDIVAWKNLAGRMVDGKVPASDGAGVVVEVGENVVDFKPGDRVAGCFFQSWQSGPFDLRHHKQDLGGSLDGMLQSHIDLSDSGVVAIPEGLDFLQASTLPCAGLTAWYSLKGRGDLKPNQTVLCIGTGGVSVFALQFAVALGARVIVLSRSPNKCERAQELGAWKTICTQEYPSWGDKVWEITEQKGVDHIIEVGGPGTLEQSMKAIAAGGHIALIGVLTGFGAPTASLFPLLARNVQLNGIYVGSRDYFQQMNSFIREHSIQPMIDQVFSFSEVPQAFEALHSSKHFGKIVVQVAT